MIKTRSGHRAIPAAALILFASGIAALQAKAHESAELPDVSGLVAEARSQADISRRDHDDRLKKTWAGLAERSCAEPGSVTQAELDALPRLRNKEIVDPTFFGLGNCRTRVYELLSLGANAEDLRRESTPAAPAEAAPLDPAAQPVRAVAGVAFESVLPRLKDYAASACARRGDVPLDAGLTAPSAPYFFSPARDAERADGLAGDPRSCEGKLFRRLIELISGGGGDAITAQSVQRIIAGY